MKIKSIPWEKWAKVPTPFPTKTKDYFISTFGRVKSVDKLTGEESLRKIAYANRVAAVSITLKGDKYFSIFVARTVANLFIENPKCYDCIIHLDRDPKNNNKKNLKWVDKSTAARYILEGEKERGYQRKKGGQVKMTASKVALLKKRLIRGKTKRKVLAKSFGITETQIKRIERGENWGHVQPAK